MPHCGGRDLHNKAKIMTLRQFLYENFGWDIYDWEIDDIRF
jgi:hypothetical protein